MTEIETKYREFCTLSFPKELAGEEVEGVEVVMLDTEIAGLIEKMISQKGNLSQDELNLLVELNQKVGFVIKKLNKPDQVYFSILYDLSLLAIENWKQ